MEIQSKRPKATNIKRHYNNLKSLGFLNLILFRLSTTPFGFVNFHANWQISWGFLRDCMISVFLVKLQWKVKTREPACTTSGLFFMPDSLASHHIWILIGIRCKKRGGGLFAAAALKFNQISVLDFSQDTALSQNQRVNSR